MKRHEHVYGVINVCQICGKDGPSLAEWKREQKRLKTIESAERAIVDAADALRSEVDGECVALFARRQDELFRAVDAWRKLREDTK